MIMLVIMLFDSHMHTSLCKHADGYLWEYVDRGRVAGLNGVVFTCHSPMPNQFSSHVRMEPDELWDYIALVGEAQDSAPEGFEVRLGLESDFFPGMESWLKQLHGTADFHYILGAVHWHTPEYQAMFFSGDMFEFQCQFFEHLAESAESGLFDCLAHPDLVKNASAEEWNLSRVMPMIENALDRIAATGVAMELNTSGFHKAFAETNPGPEMLAMMKQREIPVVLGSDAHQAERVADCFIPALELLETAGYDKISSFEDRQRQEMDIADAKLRLTEAAT